MSGFPKQSISNSLPVSHLGLFPSTAKTCIQFTLHVLKNLVDAVTEDQVTKTKVILYQSIQDMVQLTLTIFPIYIHHPGKVSSMLGPVSTNTDQLWFSL